MLQPDDSDTSVDSEVTYAESDDSIWKADDEYDNAFENEESNVVMGKENNVVGNVTEKSAKCDDTKVKILSDIKNTPENLRYFDLRNYGPFNLKKVNKIQIHKKFDTRNIYDNPIPSTSGMRQEIITKETVIEREKVAKEYNNFTTKHEDIDGYSTQKTTTNNEPQTEHFNRIYEGQTQSQQEINKFSDIPNALILGVKQESFSGAVIEDQKLTVEEMKIDECLRHNTAENKDYTNRESEIEEPTKDKKEMNDHNIYKKNDSVLVRYYERKTWVYYVGFIEGIEIKTNDTYYTVRFLKTIKKPQLKFINPKKTDRDTVPAECVVKNVNLQFVSNEYKLNESCDHIYFQ